MQPSSRVLVAVVASAAVGLAVGAVLADRSDPPPLPDSVVIEPADPTTVKPSPTPSPSGTRAPTAQPVPPRVIDDDDYEEEDDEEYDDD